MYNKLLIVTITGNIILGIYYNFYLKKVNEIEDKTVINKLDNYSSSESESESESEYLETFSNESVDNESVNSDDMYEDWKNLLVEHIDDRIIDTKYLPNNLNDDILIKNYKPIDDKKNHQKRFWILN